MGIFWILGWWWWKLLGVDKVDLWWNWSEIANKWLEKIRKMVRRIEKNPLSINSIFISINAPNQKKTIIKKIFK
jgi:hypothetical protein